MSARVRMANTVMSLLDERDDVALVYAVISGRFFPRAVRDHPERVLNVGIREQLLISAGAGLALTGMRPIIHTFASFLISRPYEQIKVSLAHQGVGAVLVSVGASYDLASAGRTHQAPEDVPLMLTIPGATIHVPGNSVEVDVLLRDAVAGAGVHYVRTSEEQNRDAFAGGLHVVRRGSAQAPSVLAFGPTLDDALEATRDIDATVLYANRLSATHGLGLGDVVESTNILVVEPWLEGATAHLLGSELGDRPRRIVHAGVAHEELRRYGTAAEHKTAHGLDAAGIRRRLDRLR